MTIATHGAGVGHVVWRGAIRGSGREHGPPVAVLAHSEDRGVRPRQDGRRQTDFLSRAERRVPEVPRLSHRLRGEAEILAADRAHAMERGRPHERGLGGGHRRRVSSSSRATADPCSR
jgi:hypothetical protein